MRVRSSPRLAGPALLIVCTTLALACNEQSPPPPAARFDRPNRVAFLCARDATVLPLDTCRTPNVESGDPLAMYALVTQAGRGEIAAVNLRQRKVLDARREIPGFTYQPVGESPSAVVVPAKHPSHTYVASFGGRDLRVIRTRTLVAAVDETPLAQTVPLVLPETGERVSPTSMVITPDERALVLGVPDAGKLLVVPIVRCAAGAADCEDGLIDEAGIRSVDLAASALGIAAPAPIEPARYERLCGYQRDNGLPRALTPAIPDGALGRAPRPSALTVDPYCTPVTAACAGRILVADDSLPLVHVLDVAALLAGNDPLLAPLVTGVPTSAVAVTPHVPRAVGDDSGLTQYVYAVDALDGSVLVLEGGFVLEVNDNAAARPDRLLLNAGRPAVRALAVLTPTFDPGNPFLRVTPGRAEPKSPSDQMCLDDDHDEQVPARLRGVFLAVAGNDGLVRVIDVHDMELLEAESGGNACRACPTDEVVPLVVRHQPRVGTSFVPGSGEVAPSFLPEAQLSFQIGDLAYQVRIDGTTASPAAPGLACMTCGEGRVRVYPTTDPDEAPEASDAGAPDGGLDGGVDAAAPSEPMTEPTPEPALLPGADPFLSDAGLDAAVPLDEVVISSCPSDRPALVCANVDPWSTPEELYTAVYEGVVYRGGTSLGRFAAPGDAENRTGALELLIDFDACSAGVLGEEEMAPEYAGCDEPPADTDLAARDGDQVVLISRPLGERALAERLAGTTGADGVISRCATLTEALDDPDLSTRAAFEIRRAYSDRLVVSSALIEALGRVRTFADLAPCYESPLSFEVRSYRAFTVTGGGTGFAHRVRANAAGRCQVDPDGDPLLRGRARLGCTFANHVFELRFGADDRLQSEPPPAGTRFEIAVSSRARKVFLDARQVGFSPATVVATDLVWNPIDEYMYLVDIADRGLLPISVDPVPPTLGTRYQYR
jgi:hypothetical protein